MRRHLTQLADAIGASSFVVVRFRKHLIVDFVINDAKVRQVVSASPSDVRAVRNQLASLRRSRRAKR